VFHATFIIVRCAVKLAYLELENNFKCHCAFSMKLLDLLFGKNQHSYYPVMYFPTVISVDPSAGTVGIVTTVNLH
jgi:hypothetical protein